MEIKGRQRLLPRKRPQQNQQVPKPQPKVAHAGRPKLQESLRRKREAQGNMEMSHLSPNARKQEQIPKWQPDLHNWKSRKISS